MFLVIVGFLLSLVVLRRCVKWVSPGGVQLMYDLEGNVRTLGPGIHLLPHPLFFRMYSDGPFLGIARRDHDGPNQGTRVTVNPPPVQIQTRDSVPGRVDVTTEGEVLPWSKEDFLKARGLSFRSLAATRINQWVSRTLGLLPASEVTYSKAMTALNAKEALADLNSNLVDCSLLVQRVSIDPDGVKLSQTYSNNLNKINSQLQQTRAEQEAIKEKIEVEKLESEKQQLKTEAEGRRREIDAQTALRVAKIEKETELQKTMQEKERVTSLVAAGLDPRDIANLLVVEASSAMMKASSAQKIVAVPPGILGLHGLEAVRGSSETSSFVAVQ